MEAAGDDLNALLKDGRPDWDAITFPVHCSRCGYNLYTLTKPRCPECGLQFDWDVVLDRSAWRSDFLFEHYWRDRPVRSWFRTVWRALRPFRFWRDVSIHDRIHAGPLWFLLVWAVLVHVVLFHGLAALIWIASQGADLLAFHLGVVSVPSLGGIAFTFRGIARMPGSGAGYLTFPGLLLLLILSALALLCSLRQTLSRCRVRTVQVLRVVAYSATPVCAAWAVVYLLLIGVEVSLLSWGMPAWAGAACGWVMLAATPAILAIYLYAGIKRYLLLPRALLLALTAAGVSFLLVNTLIVFVQVTSTIGWG
ncbi:MAG TPA: hypothetical protein VM243_19100 [Phycisphaerae bacterium]|nr:hypothetical protein [Phycisphaerae bacterium]